MAEHEITQEIMRKIQADLAELRTRVDAGFARVDTQLAHIDEAIRGLARITIGLVGSVDSIKDRLLALEGARQE